MILYNYSEPYSFRWLTSFLFWKHYFHLKKIYYILEEKNNKIFSNSCKLNKHTSFSNNLYLIIIFSKLLLLFCIELTLSLKMSYTFAHLCLSMHIHMFRANYQSGFQNNYFLTFFLKSCIHINVLCKNLTHLTSMLIRLKINLNLSSQVLSSFELYR